MADIVKVRCKCGAIFDQERNGNFHINVGMVKYDSCHKCSPDSASYSPVFFKKNGDKFYSGIDDKPFDNSP